jgi:hypothetical protein
MLSVGMLSVGEVPQGGGAYQYTRCQSVLPNTLLTSSCKLCRCCAQRGHLCNMGSCASFVTVTRQRASCANTMYNKSTASQVHLTQQRQSRVTSRQATKKHLYDDAP